MAEATGVVEVTETPPSTRAAASERMDWLDQARGMVVLLLIVSMITGAYEGSPLTGDKILGPTFLNHGYQYYDGIPPVVTLIDIGQPGFMFVVGLVGYLAFTRRRERYGSGSAWRYAARRVVLLYAFGWFEEAVLNRTLDGTMDLATAIYDGTFAKLAMGSLVAYIAITVVRRADARAILAACMVAAHALLYVFPVFDHHGWQDDLLGLPYFPFGAMNLAAVAVAGTCFAQWFRIDPEEPLVGIRQRILPVTTGACVAYYCMEWLQPAEHHDETASLALLTIAVAGFFTMAFYTFGRHGLRFPILSSLGKNLLLMFALGWFVVNAYLSFLPKEMLVNAPFLALVLAGIVPIAALSALAVYLDRKNIIIRA